MDSFEYESIEYNQLNKKEKEIYNTKEEIFKLLKVNYDKELVKIAKSQLESIEKFEGTLAHEIIHFNKGEDDITRSFEWELTITIGKLLKNILNCYKND